ncbi:helix-turn-helix domain-containing protein [Chryseobacterium culicis]|uniref:helix-turn-helix domain-containing protein n=1 Tax=Chryseobacterium culicis TaxID=680127 RepID=UPI00187558A7|nr:helix-turn-helix domain-containing protein [Chryseobacterium culicis]MBE4950881.1 helix-turn-helix domain-containing protein [Chryseobacterium culicis]
MNDIIITHPNNLKEMIREVINEEAYKFTNWLNSRLVDEEKTLTRQQAADYLNMSLSTLHRHTKQGDIQAYGIGSRVYYKLNDIKSAMRAIN